MVYGLDWCTLYIKVLSFSHITYTNNGSKIATQALIIFWYSASPSNTITFWTYLLRKTRNTLQVAVQALIGKILGEAEGRN